MFDATTAAAYIAAASNAARAQAVSDSLGASLTAEIYDGASLVYTGTFTGPLAAVSGTVSITANAVGNASAGGTPDPATWKLRITNGSDRWMEGSLGVGGRFVLSSLATGQTVRLNIEVSAYVSQANPYNLSVLGSPRLIFSDATETARLDAMVTGSDASYLRFKNMVDAYAYDGSDYSIWHLALLGKVSGNTTYLTNAVTYAMTILASEEAKIVAYGNSSSNIQPAAAGDSYLGAGDSYVFQQAVVYDWCRDQMTSAQRARVIAYVNQVLYNLLHPSSAAWGGRSANWNGWGTTNPKNNYYYSMMVGLASAGLATYGENDSAQTWLDTFRTTKLQEDLLAYMTANNPAGGSFEGVGYGQYVALRLGLALYLWQTATGERAQDLTSYMLDSEKWYAHATLPTLTKMSPNGDWSRSSNAAANYTEVDRNVFQVFSSLFPVEAPTAAVQTLIANARVTTATSHRNYVYDFLWKQNGVTPAALSTLGNIYFAQGLGHIFTRTGWAATDTYVEFSCGPALESHDHQDKGSVVIFKGEWLAFDGNQVGSSGIWGALGATNGTEPHSMVRFKNSGVNIRQNGSGAAIDACSDSAYYTYALGNVTQGATGVYAQYGSTTILKYEREMVWIKPDCVVLFDRVQTSGAGIERIWQMCLPQTPTVAGDNFSMTGAGGHTLEAFGISPGGITPAQIALTGSTVAKRIEFSHSTGDTTLFLYVIGLDGDVASATASNATGQTGVAITFTDGRTATVRFNNAATGGTIDLRASGGAVQVAESFTTTVDL